VGKIRLQWLRFWKDFGIELTNIFLFDIKIGTGRSTTALEEGMRGVDTLGWM